MKSPPHCPLGDARRNEGKAVFWLNAVALPAVHPGALRTPWRDRLEPVLKSTLKPWFIRTDNVWNSLIRCLLAGSGMP